MLKIVFYVDENSIIVTFTRHDPVSVLIGDYQREWSENSKQYTDGADIRYSYQPIHSVIHMVVEFALQIVV